MLFRSVEENETDNKKFEQIKIKENGRDYVISSNGYIYGVDNYYPRGEWEWDGSKPIFNLFKTDNKKVVGFVSDSDTDWSAVLESNKIMGLGSKGPLVQEVQQSLIKNGDAEGLIITKDTEGCKENKEKCDGIYGRQTQKAVIKAQQRLQIAVDGVVGNETYNALV